MTPGSDQLRLGRRPTNLLGVLTTADGWAKPTRSKCCRLETSATAHIPEATSEAVSYVGATP